MKSTPALSFASGCFVGTVFFMSLWTIVNIRNTAKLHDRMLLHDQMLKREVQQPEAKSDPLRNFNASEVDEWLQYCEDTPENRKKWAEAGTPMKFEKKNAPTVSE